MSIALKDGIDVASQYSDATLIAVGRLLITFAAGETVLTLQLGRVNLHPHPATVNSMVASHGMATKVKLAKIVSGAGMINYSKWKDTEKICNKIRKLYDHRNAIAHNDGLLGKGDKLALTMLGLRTNGQKIPDKTYDYKQIEQFSDSLGCRLKQLDQHLTEIGIAPLPKFVELAHQ